MFAEIGGFIAQGVGVGFKNEMPKVNEQLETELDKLSDVNTKQINVGVSFEVYKMNLAKLLNQSYKYAKFCYNNEKYI